MEEVLGDKIEFMPPAVLYLEDLQRIDTILQRAADSGDVKIRVMVDRVGYDLENLEELENEMFRDRKLNSMNFDIGEPSVRVSLLPDRLSIYLSEETTKSLGIMTAVKEIIEPRTRRLYWLQHKAVFVITSILICVGLPFLLAMMKLSLWYSLSCIPFVIIPWYAVLDKGGGEYFFDYATIYPRRRALSPSFLARNKDNLLMLAIVTIIGMLAQTALMLIVRLISEQQL